MTSVNDFKDGISACTNIGTTTELNMRDFFNSKGISSSSFGSSSDTL